MTTENCDAISIHKTVKTYMTARTRMQHKDGIWRALKW